MSSSKVSEAVRQLEDRLSARLLQRSTRQVIPTSEGEAYYERCVAIIADVDEAEAAFCTAEPRGRLRIDVPGDLARRYLLPQLPAFLERYPGVQLHIGEGDRLVDLVGEGIDCVIRVAQLASSGLVARRIALLEECTLASPAYLLKYGTPKTLEDLDGHRAIGFVSSATGSIIPLEFQIDGGIRRVVLPNAMTVSSTIMNAALARLGFGLIQVPRYNYKEDIDAGRLVEVLPQHPPTPSPVYVLYPEGRQLLRRVRVFVDWAVEQFASAGLT